MASVLFFMLGALFCLGLLAAVVALVPVPATAQAAHGFVSQHAPERRRAGTRTANPERAPEAGAGRDRPRLAPPPVRSSREREAYRVAVALDRVEAALGRIIRSDEPAAAKIAGQTLRRLKSGDAPAAARLAFARGRLELIALRPDPSARVLARQALFGLDG